MKYVFYVLGIMILTFGISVTIQSDLGTSPFDALIVGLSVHAGLTVGSWEIIIAFLLICCNSMLKRQRPEFSGMITAFITGIGIDMWLFSASSHNAWTMVRKGGLFCNRFSCDRDRNRNLPAHKFRTDPGWSVNVNCPRINREKHLFSRTVIYFIFFILAVMLKGPVGIGTLLTVCLGGVILHFFMPITGRWIDGILTASPKQEETKTR